MKKVLYFLVLFSSFSYAQPGITSYLTGVSPCGGNCVFEIENDYSDISVEGSPYLDEKFRPAKISVNGKLENKIEARYNALKEEIEIIEKNNSTQPYSLLRRDYVQVKIGDRFYEIYNFVEKDQIKKGYFNPLNDGETRLLLRAKKKLTKAKIPVSGYESYFPPSYVEDFSYYLKKGDSPAKQIKLNKRKLLDLLSDKAESIENYISQNSLKLKNETEVLELLNYYNSLN